MLAHDYMLNAAYDIDGQFGAGYAKTHPELVGAYVQAAALNFAACLLADKLSELREFRRSGQAHGQGQGKIQESNPDSAHAS
jgi:hypothetical protein